ncbi:MAG: hypothetical protein AB1522_16375 [Chloroflexota bacterium]
MAEGGTPSGRAVPSVSISLSKKEKGWQKVVPMIETTINAQTKTYLKEADLARMISRLEFNQDYAVQIFNFFTDLPLQDIERFMVRNQVDDETLKAYYQKYIKEFYPRPELEEMLL